VSRRRVAIAWILCCLLVGGCRAAPAPPETGPGRAASARGLTALHVRGNSILDAADRTVRLLGFNQSGTEYACIEGWGIFDAPDSGSISPSVIEAMAGWRGANTVRVPLNEQCWLGIGVPTRYGGAAYRRAIVGYVTALRAQGFAVVLDLHRSAPGSAPSRDQEQMPDRDHSVEFWRQVARTFRGDRSVLFDLFNEPAPFGVVDSPPAWRCWRDGGCLLRSVNGGGSYVAAGMNELIRAIRSQAASNIVVAGGIDWSENLRGWLEYKPTDPLGNLIADFHAYSFNTECASERCYNSDLARVVAAVPLIAGEVGPDLTIDYDQAHARCPREAVSSTGFDRTLLDWLDAYGAGFTAWTFNTWSSCWALVTNWSGTPTSAWGRWFRSRLAVSTRFG